MLTIRKLGIESTADIARSDEFQEILQFSDSDYVSENIWFFGIRMKILRWTQWVLTLFFSLITSNFTTMFYAIDKLNG